MKTIETIFKDNPQLLDKPEVKELIEQFELQFKALKSKHWHYWDDVTRITMESSMFVRKGKSPEKALEEINEISFNTYHP